MVFLRICLLTLCGFSWATANNDNLTLVQVFFRHGSRTPDLKDIYPNDPYTIKDFQPYGFGHLTDAGKLRAYKLGENLRQRYNSYLGDLYYPEIVDVTTTDVFRTKMSALLVLAGLFPPSKYQRFDEKLPWIPIPYNYEKLERDTFLARPNRYCPRYVKELQKQSVSPRFKNILHKNKSILQHIQENSGNKMSSLLDVFNIYQVLRSEQDMNYTLPDWTKKVYPEPITTLAAMQCELESSNTIMKRLFGGRSIKRVVENIESKRDGKLENRKIILHSGHEFTVFTVMSALGVYDVHFPDYSSAVIIESKYDESLKDIQIKVLYAKHVDQPVIELDMPACPNKCTLTQFKKVFEDIIPKDLLAECNEVEENNEKLN